MGGGDCVSNQQRHDCLLNCIFSRSSKKTSKLHVTGLWAGISLVNSEFPAHMATNMENVSILWRHNIMEVSAPHYSPKMQVSASTHP